MLIGQTEEPESPCIFCPLDSARHSSFYKRDSTYPIDSTSPKGWGQAGCARSILEHCTSLESSSVTRPPVGAHNDRLIKNVAPPRRTAMAASRYFSDWVASSNHNLQAVVPSGAKRMSRTPLIRTHPASLCLRGCSAGASRTFAPPCAGKALALNPRLSTPGLSATRKLGPQ
jgi:hypothetical protein